MDILTAKSRIEKAIKTIDEAFRGAVDEFDKKQLNLEGNGFKVINGIGKIYWSAESLLDQSLMEALEDFINAHASVGGALNNLRLHTPKR